MAGWILLLDPSVYNWKDMPRIAEQIAQGKRVVRLWECGRNRRIKKGDRVFFLRKGRDPMGLFAAGTVTRIPREESGVDVPNPENERRKLVIDVELEALVDSSRFVSLPLLILQKEFPSFQWQMRESAAQPLPENLLARLESAFAKEHEKVMEEAAKTLPAAAQNNIAKPVAQKPDADPLRLMVAGAYFSMLKDVCKGELPEPETHLGPVKGLLHREPDYDFNKGLRQLSALAMSAGLPLLERYKPQAIEDAKLEEAFHAFCQRFPDLLKKLSNRASAWLPEKWPHIDDSRLYWTSPPSAGLLPRHSAGVRVLPEYAFALRETVSPEWHKRAVEFAVEYEKVRLLQNSQRQNIADIKIAERDGIGGEGWDITSFEADGSPRRIAVKATRFSRFQPFALCGAELEAARDSGGTFHVYRLFDVMISPRFYILQSRLRDAAMGDQDIIDNGIRALEWQRVNLSAPWMLNSGKRAQLLYDYFI